MWKVSGHTRRNLMSFLALLVVIGLTATTAFAVSPHFGPDTSFSLGSLIGDGTVAGLGNEDAAVTLDAVGMPVVTCTNKGGGEVSGQNPPPVSAHGSQFLAHETYTTTGTSPFHVETAPPEPLSATDLGCPSNTWTATIDFVFWKDAGLAVTAGGLTSQQKFTCTTLRNPDSIGCTPLP